MEDGWTLVPKGGRKAVITQYQGKTTEGGREQGEVYTQTRIMRKKQRRGRYRSARGIDD